MKASKAEFLELLKKSTQFVIPIYQRTYSWTEKECRQLWDDIIACGRNNNIPVHFIGSIVYVERGLSQVTNQEPLLVIDGQQRLTTLTLLLAALSKAVGTTEPFDGFSQFKICKDYLLNPKETGERRYKLLLTQTDKDTLKSLVSEQPKPHSHSLRIEENYTLFQELIRREGGDLLDLCKGLTKLVVVDIALNREQNPQLIFESMNSTGKELSQADLIRNFILMGLEQTLQTRLYENYWRPMEVNFGQENYASHFDEFMRHYLTVKTGDIPNINDVYETFKKYALKRADAVSNDSHVESLLNTIKDYSEYFCAISLGKETDKELKMAFNDLSELKVDVACPFLMELYCDYKKDIFSKGDFVQAVRWVEAYVFRRVVCEIPSNSMNKTFASFIKALKKDRYLESIAAHFLLFSSQRRFPSDDEFENRIQVRKLYKLRNPKYCLRRIENHGRKECVPVDDEYTVEHIMPQNENLSAAWQAELGSEWKLVQQTWQHTLGNLTLTGYNSEYRDRPFIQKRDMDGGFKNSPLNLNKDLNQVTVWNESAIKERANRLAKQAVVIWNSPKLDESILAGYRPKVKPGSEYTINDHPSLLNSPLRTLFEAFRTKVLELDPPYIREEWLKYYVAYKVETNFVDVMPKPQLRRLQLSLKMSISEVNDPKKLCKDVSRVGHMGNGDVEVSLSSLEDLPYVIELVQQALEKQLVGVSIHEK